MIFVKIDGIEGESDNKGHEKWCRATSISNAVHRKVSSGAIDTSRVRGSTTVGDVLVTKYLDKASVKLQEKCAAGEPIGSVEIHVCAKIANSDVTVLKYLLTNVYVTEYSLNCANSEESSPVESVALNFEKIEWAYTEIDHQKGSKKGDVVSKYNASKGVKE